MGLFNLGTDVLLVILIKCVTENGKELTRVCVIDFASKIVVFDQLVKPSKPILDYLTRFFVSPCLHRSLPYFLKKFHQDGQELQPKLLPP